MGVSPPGVSRTLIGIDARARLAGAIGACLVLWMATARALGWL